jgi:hypothetical protein
MLSHCWADLEQTAFIDEYLRALPFVMVAWDREHVTADGGDQVHEQVERIVRGSDVVVTHLTDRALASTGVLDELARANSLGKPILVIRPDNPTCR